jgi:hypothetical protein
MKSFKILVISILVTALLAALSACGNNKNATDQQSDSQQQTAATQQSDAAQSSTQAGTGQQAIVTESMQTADPKASVDDLIGSWTDINSPDRFAKITKTDTGYQYEDNEGKYPATYKDGVLKVKVSDNDTDTADIYIDKNTGHMISTYQDNISEYSKK